MTGDGAAGKYILNLRAELSPAVHVNVLWLTVRQWRRNFFNILRLPAVLPLRQSVVYVPFPATQPQSTRLGPNLGMANQPFHERLLQAHFIIRLQNGAGFAYPADQRALDLRLALRLLFGLSGWPEY